MPIGTILNDTYRVEGLLGVGGMAKVYLVAHTRLPRRFALKLVTPEFSTDPIFLDRFRQEAVILGGLRHPHLVDVVDWNVTASGHPYLVMELLEGEDLSRFLSRSGPLAPAVALAICRQIADALEYAHNAGVVHRDLKPANIFLCARGHQPNFVKILDFGVAKMIGAGSSFQTAAETLIGTPAYMSPEQALGESADVDARTDQFALAVILHEMLSGRGAFASPGDSTLAVLDRVLRYEPAPLPFPRIDHAVRKALSKRRADRFASVKDFLAALDPEAAHGDLAQRSTLTSKTGELSGRSAPRSRRAAPLWWAGVALLGLLGGWRAIIAHQRSALIGPSQSARGSPDGGRESPASAPALPAPPVPDMSDALRPAAPDMSDALRRPAARAARPHPAPAAPRRESVRAVITGAGKPGSSHAYIRIRICVRDHLDSERLQGKQIRLFRGGTLHVNILDRGLLRDGGFESCLEEIGADKRLPDNVTIRFVKEQIDDEK